MKKTITLVLCLSFLLSLASCSSSLESTETHATTEETQNEKTETKQETIDDSPIIYPHGFSVGYARETVNPGNGTGLGGYGTQNDRLSNKITNDLKLTCTALCDSKSAVLIFSTDLLSIPSSVVSKCSSLIMKAYGIPAENIIFNATHTHAGPAIANSNAPGIAKYSKLYYEAAQKIAGEALRDLEEATILTGKGKTDKLNFVRRYVSKIDGSYLGKNLPDGQDPNKVMHETQSDEEMQIIQFDRKTKKDVILCNWQCHPTSAGGASNGSVSADWVGALRDKVEKEKDVLFSYHQGGAGNVTAGSHIKGNPSYGYIEHGEKIADTAMAIMASLSPVSSGTIQAAEIPFTAEYKEEITSGAKKSSYPNKFHLNVIAIGDIAFAAMPGEPHDTLGMTVKQESPFQMTFFCGYSEGAIGYIPAEFAFKNGGYEVESTNFAKGTGESIISELIKQLKAFYEAK